MTDDEIIALFFERSESAIAHTKTQYGRLLYRIAENILHSAEDAEECESETYLRAWNSIPPSRPERLCAYLCRIARRLALDRWDYLHAAKRGCAVALDELEDVLKSTSHAEERLTESELTALLNRFLSAQDYSTRVIFMRRFWFGDSIADIAKRFGKSEGMVKSRLSRTMSRLRETLRTEGYDV